MGVLFSVVWWAQQGSNLRPADYESAAANQLSYRPTFYTFTVVGCPGVEPGSPWFIDQGHCRCINSPRYKFGSDGRNRTDYELLMKQLPNHSASSLLNKCRTGNRTRSSLPYGIVLTITTLGECVLPLHHCDIDWQAAKELNPASRVLETQHRPGGRPTNSYTLTQARGYILTYRLRSFLSTGKNVPSLALLPDGKIIFSVIPTSVRLLSEVSNLLVFPALYECPSGKDTQHQQTSSGPVYHSLYHRFDERCGCI